MTKEIQPTDLKAFANVKMQLLEIAKSANYWLGAANVRRQLTDHLTDLWSARIVRDYELIADSIVRGDGLPTIAAQYLKPAVQRLS